MHKQGASVLACRATKWLGTNKTLIMLSLRVKSDDKLWFSFFHQAGHLLKHGKRMIFLDTLGEDGLNPQEEKEADTFARDLLIPPAEYRALLAQSLINERTIRNFAKHIGWQPLNHLKVSYRWTHEAEGQ